MTGAEWQSWEEPDQMLRYLGRRLSRRKFRLSRRKLRYFIIGLRLPKSALQFSAGLVQYGEPSPKVEAICPALQAWADSDISITEVPRNDPRWCFLQVIQRFTATRGGFKRLYWDRERLCALRLVESNRSRIQKRRVGKLLTEIVGNPFRPVVFDLEWRSDTTVSLAKHIYESRDFAQMPILADALQDTGCDNADVLNHCRDTSLTHVRGCWVVDLVLGKT